MAKHLRFYCCLSQAWQMHLPLVSEYLHHGSGQNLPHAAGRYLRNCVFVYV